jgi:hypothetical protein
MQSTTDPMPLALTAAGPHPDHTADLDLYGQLVGVWDVDNRFYDETLDRWRDTTVVWTFGWILDGLAVQDVMRFTLEDGSTVTGSTVRHFDPRNGTWTVVWFAPGGRTLTLVGRRSDDGIHQEGTQPDGRAIRWTFSELTRESFHWLGHVRDDGGADWRLEQEMYARRRI